MVGENKEEEGGRWRRNRSCQKKRGGYVDNRKFTVIEAIVLFIRCNEF